jgi:hypothetical protein
MSRSSAQLSLILQQVREGRIECSKARRVIDGTRDFDFPHAAKVLSFLNHYWDDEDIRQRDKDYRTMQNDELDKLISRLTGFEYESASEVTFLHVS